MWPGGVNKPMVNNVWCIQCIYAYLWFHCAAQTGIFLRTRASFNYVFFLGIHEEFQYGLSKEPGKIEGLNENIKHCQIYIGYETSRAQYVVS